jgi:hypothetical protein
VCFSRLLSALPSTTAQRLGLGLEQQDGLSEDAMLRVDASAEGSVSGDAASQASGGTPCAAAHFFGDNASPNVQSVRDAEKRLHAFESAEAWKIRIQRELARCPSMLDSDEEEEEEEERTRKGSVAPSPSGTLGAEEFRTPQPERGKAMAAAAQQQKWRSCGARRRKLCGLEAEQLLLLLLAPSPSLPFVRNYH